VTYTEHARRKTVTAMDVVYALKRQGRTLYGFGVHLDVSRAAVIQLLHRYGMKVLVFADIIQVVNPDRNFCNKYSKVRVMKVKDPKMPSNVNEMNWVQASLVHVHDLELSNHIELRNTS
ncbi:histone H4, partial [Tanacetum coccineum]